MTIRGGAAPAQLRRTAKSPSERTLTTITPRSSFLRAFACWPSRIGALALVALALSLGSEAFADGATPPAPQKVSISAR